MAYVNVEGEVSRLNRTGNGFGLKELREFNGKTITKYWAVFPKENAGVNVGDAVKVSGFLDAKVGDPKTGTDGVERRYVDLVVSSAKVEVARQDEQDAQESWGGDSYGDSTPF